MQTYQFVNVDFPTLNPSQELTEIIDLFSKNHVQTLPVVDKHVFKGLLHLNDVVSALISPNPKRKKLKFDDRSFLVSDFKRTDIKGVLHLSHLFDCIRFFDEFPIDILPVVDEKNKYIGCVTVHHLNRMMGEFLNVYDNGSVIEIEFAPYNYSITEMVKLIEEHSARISSLLWLPENSEMHRHRVMIKLNLIDGARLVDVLQRNGFQARISTYQEAAELDLKERAQELLKYLNV